MSYGVGLRNGVAFALGTIPSLTSGGGLRPSLLLDFLSGSLDPRITFSRGTQAMQYGSDGTLQYAPNNLLTYSNQADNAAWTKSNSFVQTNLLQYSNAFTTAPWNVRGTAALTANATTAPDGTNNGWLVTGIGALLNDLFQQITVASGVAYTPSFWIKRVSTTGTLQIANPAGTNGVMNVNFALLSDSWERITPTHPAVTVTSAFAGSVGNTGGIHFLNPFGGTLSFYLYGAQVVLGSVPGNYQATTSAALPVLYADYNGALRARKLCENNAAAVAHSVFQDSVATTVGAIHTASVVLKAAERTWAIVQAGVGFTGNPYFFVNLATGAAGTQVGAPTAVSVTALGGGYYRCSITAVTSAANARVAVFTTTGDGVVTYTGDGSSGIYIADAQLTPGYLPLAVTETTSAAVYGPRFDYDPSSLVTQNLLTYSQAFENAVWGAFDVSHIVSANSAVAPDGTLTADAWTWPASTTNYGYGAQTITGDASQAYTYSVWARLQTGAKNVRLKISNVTVATLTSANIGLTTTWQRISYSIAAGALARTTQVGVAFELGSSSSVAAGDIIELWGAQLNQGSTALPYTATTTAPYTLTTARGLLIEEQRTNLLLQSNDFQTSWLLTNITRTLANTTSPEGVLNGVKIEATATAGAFATQLRQSAVVAATSATGSVYVKQGTSATKANEFLIRNSTTATDLIAGTLNYSTGVFTYTTGSTGVVVTNVGNGWWRISVTATAGITSGDAILWYVGWVGAAATAGDFLYAYGAQLEAGAFATSYIPTVGSTATRNGESISIPASTWYNIAAGTWYFNGETQTYPRYLVMDASGASKYPMYLHGVAGGVATYDGTTTVLTANTTVAGITFNAATAYGAGTMASVLNAGTVASNVYNGSFSTIASFLFGNSQVSGIAGSGNICGHIRSIRYYPTKLPNASLQSITV